MTATATSVFWPCPGVKV